LDVPRFCDAQDAPGGELKLHAVLSTAGRKETQAMDGSVPFACHE